MSAARTLTQNRVFTCARPNPAAALRLFCFPYAGGNPSTFWSWPERLPWVEVCALQLPGRGGRVTEPPFASLDPLIREATRGFAPYLDKPFAFFGHSMGALISFELARRLRAEGRRGPLKMFVSGCRAPQMPNRAPLTYNLPEPEFVKELKRLKGTPPEVFESQELMQLVLPVLRADFGICQTYAYQHEPPLACPIYAFGGLED